MAQFIAAVHADSAPLALALVETAVSPSGQTYTLRDIRSLGDNPIDEISRVLASEPQYVGSTRVVTTGGQRVADALHAKGPSAVAVTLVSEEQSPDQDAFDVSAQVLVDTFEMLFRAGAVSVPTDSEVASSAVHALYRGADLENAALDGDRDDDGEPNGPDPDRIAQSGSEASVSTMTVKSPINAREASVAAVEATERVGRIAAHTGEGAPDLGDHEGVALALALAVWYGETSADELPMTDQADEILDKRDRRNAARSS